MFVGRVVHLNGRIIAASIADVFEAISVLHTAQAASDFSLTVLKRIIQVK